MSARLHRLGRVAAVIALAAGAGHFVQNENGTAGVTRGAAAAPAFASVPPVGDATVHRPTPPAVPPAIATAAADLDLAPAVASPALAAARPSAPEPPAGALVDLDLGPAAPTTRADTLLPAGPEAAPAGEGTGGEGFGAEPVAASLSVAAHAAAGREATPSEPDAPPFEGVAEACTERLELAAEPDAMLALTLVAPCHAATPVVLQHAGLSVSLRIPADGHLALAFPALDPEGAVTVRFADGHRVSGAAPVGDLDGRVRVALQWSPVDSFALHAFAPGAVHGGPGHVSAGRPGARDGAAGWIVALGDAGVPAPLIAEVYTFPADRDGVTLEVDAALTPATCGREAIAELIEWADGRHVRRELVMPMPDCDGGEGYLVLQNPVADTKLAAN